MRPLNLVLLLSLTLFLIACGDDSSSLPPDPSTRTYLGEEVLAGGTFPITITINDAGNVRVIDVDGLVAVGNLEGENFVATRGGNAPQVFTGIVSGEQITGTTTGNPFLGKGTFSATLRP